MNWPLQLTSKLLLLLLLLLSFTLLTVEVRSVILWRYKMFSNIFPFVCIVLQFGIDLSRVSHKSVVHHAALNCIRRIFAVVVTSIVFNIPNTFLGGCGITVSFGGFMAFTHHKSKRNGATKGNVEFAAYQNI
jgi:hypothetical protein